MKPALLLQFVALSRLSMVCTNGMRLQHANRRGLCGGGGRGQGRGQGQRGHGCGNDYGNGGWQREQTGGMAWSRGGGYGRNSNDMATIQNLVDNRAHIKRTVEKTDDGVKTHTWSDEKQVSDWIIEHVKAMKKRMEDGYRIRQRDPLFVAAFDHAHLIDDFVVDVEDDGVKVVETSSDRCTIDILHRHSDVVTGFINNGRYELRRNHPVPGSCPEGRASR